MFNRLTNAGLHKVCDTPLDTPPDVDGIPTANPRFVLDARSLRQVSYREAAEISYFSAKVLHPKTRVLAIRKRIPIRIRSTFEPDLPGTRVADTTEPVLQGVKNVTSTDGLALVKVDGRSMAGLPGIAHRIFEATEVGANVIMISQARSEQTVSFVVPGTGAPALVIALRESFQLELHTGAVQYIESR